MDSPARRGGQHSSPGTEAVAVVAAEAGRTGGEPGTYQNVTLLLTSPPVQVQSPHQGLIHLGLREVEANGLPVGGRLKFFLKNWELLTRDQHILNVVRGYKIEFLTTPLQGRKMFCPHFSKEEAEKIDWEVQLLLQKQAIEETLPTREQFLGHLFLRPKKDGSMRPVFNLKGLNEFIPYEHFKMEGMLSVTNLIEESDWLAKIDLKDAYFCVPMDQSMKKFLRFQWRGQLYQFRVLPFGLASAPRVFTKVLKPVIAFLRRIGVRLVIYLDDILLMNKHETGLAKDVVTVMELLKALGFVVNMAKSVLTPARALEYLGFQIDTIAMSLALPQGKVKAIQDKCQELVKLDQTSVRELSQLIGKLSASILAVRPGPLNYRHLQMQKSKALFYNRQSYAAIVCLTKECKVELNWWRDSLQDWNGRAMISPNPDLVITTDASKKGWGAECEGRTTQGQWSVEETKIHINVLELTAALFAIQVFVKDRQNIVVHMRLDNKSAVAHINKMGGTRSPQLVKVTKEMWQYALSRKITLTAEYLPGKDNVIADRESRIFKDTSNWKLLPVMFRAIETALGPLHTDLFADRLSAQKAQYMSWKPDPHAMATDAFSRTWVGLQGYAFPPFGLVGKCLAKIRKDQSTVVIVTPAWQTQIWYPLLLEMSIETPILLPPHPKILLDPQGNEHPLIKSDTLCLAAWKVSGEDWKQKAFQKGLQKYTFSPVGQAHELLTTAPGKNGIAGVTQGKLIQFRPLWEM